MNTICDICNEVMSMGKFHGAWHMQKCLGREQYKTKKSYNHLRHYQQMVMHLKERKGGAGWSAMASWWRVMELKLQDNGWSSFMYDSNDWCTGLNDNGVATGRRDPPCTVPRPARSHSINPKFHKRASAEELHTDSDR